MRPSPRYPLYPEPSRLVIETTIPRAYDSGCTLCPLHLGARQPIQGESVAGSGPSLLVVAEGPGPQEDASGRPFYGRSGAFLRPLLRKHWPAPQPIHLDNATRCFPGAGSEKRQVTEAHVKKCRPYLADTVRSVKPDRVLALGVHSAYSLTGRAVSPITTRRGYTWLWNHGNPIPVFFLIHPAAGLRNRFLRRFFEKDLEWALTVKLKPPRHLFAGFTYSLVTTKEEAERAAEDLQNGDGFAFDVETGGRLWDDDFRVVCLGACGVGQEQVWVWDEEALQDPEVFGPLRRLLEDPDQEKGGSNVKYDANSVLCGLGVQIRGITFDTRLWRKLLDPEASGKLSDMAELVGMGGHKAEAGAALATTRKRLAKMIEHDKQAAARKQIGFGFTQQVDARAREGFDVLKYEGDLDGIAYAFMEKDLLHRYNARDVLSTARLASQLGLQLHRSPNRRRIWEKIIHPASLAISRVEQWGVPYDRGAGHLFNLSMGKMAEVALQKVKQYGDINPDSPPQLVRVLYQDLGLKPSIYTDGGAPSTNEDALELLKHQHPLPAAILEYRHYRKLAGYAVDWDRCVRADGRIHPSIHLDGARSGRTSASDPNLQNIPRASDSEEGKMARNCFRAPPGCVLIQIDYSQLELRIAALLARDLVMARTFKSGVDFHLATAQLIAEAFWGIKPEDVQKPHRTAAKAVNFGVLYGKGDKGLAEDLNIPEPQAKKIRESILGEFKDLSRWVDKAHAYAEQHGGCWTQWEGEPARWRPLWRIGDTSKEGAYFASVARNGAVNSPIQGTASEFCVASLARLVQRIEAGQLDAEVVLPIHDSIMLVAPEKTLKDVASEAAGIMSDYPWASDFVPLEVDVEVGTHWGDLEKLKI